MNTAFRVKTNMVGHLVMDGNEVEVTAGFAGAKGNLIWLNTGDSDLLLRMRTRETTQSVILGKGLGSI